SEQLPTIHRLGRRIKVITLIRDPIATNLSGYFYNCIALPGQLREAAQQGKPGVMEQLAENFLAQYPHDVPVTWFDMEMKDVFAIDVFAAPFPKEQGYQIYRSEWADLLLFKLDQLNECAEVAFSSFMNLPE